METYSSLKDGHGLATHVEDIVGVGLIDWMVKETLGPDGIIYPAYGCINDETYKKI